MSTNPPRIQRLAEYSGSTLPHEAENDVDEDIAKEIQRAWALEEAQSRSSRAASRQSAISQSPPRGRNLSDVIMGNGGGEKGDEEEAEEDGEEEVDPTRAQKAQWNSDPYRFMQQGFKFSPLPEKEPELGPGPDASRLTKPYEGHVDGKELRRNVNEDVGEDKEKGRYRFDWRGLAARSSRNWLSFDVVEAASLKIPLVAYLLFFTIGYSPWFLVNALFLQLPFLMDLPPQEAIASHLALSIQAGNVFIPLYLILRRRSLVTVGQMMGLLFLLTFLLGFSFALTWHVQILSPEKVDSVYYGLMALASLAGAVGCLSNTTFWEFTAHYHPNLISALAVGNAFSSVIPALLATIQFSRTPALFGFSPFFLVSSAFLFFPVVAFMGILHSSTIKGLKREEWAGETRKLGRPTIVGSPEYSVFVPSPSQTPPGNVSRASFADHAASPNKRPPVDLSVPEGAFSEESPLMFQRSPSSTYSEKRPGSALSRPPNSETDPDMDYFLPEASAKEISIAWKELLVMFWISFMTYIIPSVLTFLVRGYEYNDDTLVYATITGMVGSTLGRVASGFFSKIPHIPFILLQLVTGVIFFLGAPLEYQSWLGWLIVAVNFVFTFQFGLQSTLLFKTASMHIDSRFALKLCRWLGVAEQGGALTSALLTFGLVRGGAFGP